MITKRIGSDNIFCYEITNESDKDIFLDDFVLFSCDNLSALGINSGSLVFRSGRHKNDMPSVFRLGCFDAAMKDAIGGMTETGDKKEAASVESIIVSDHITILGDNDNYLVISYPDARNQFVETDIYVDSMGNFVRLVCRALLGIRLCPGKSVTTERISFTYAKNPVEAIEEFAADKAGRFGARNSEHPSVFCTWYYYGLTVTYEDVKTNLLRMKEKKLPFEVFQVDEGWEITLGEWEPNKKFPIPMKVVADEIREAGYRPGIWTSPFVAHETANVWTAHPEWILKDKAGKPCLFPMNDTVYYVFDITNPDTWDYFYELYHRLTFEWGYTYHKLDFTRAAVIMKDAVYYDDTVTLVECYVNAVKAIRRGMGDDSYFLMCGGLYDPIIGIVDAQRTGSDVLSMWSSNINKDGKTQPYTVKQSILRYYMNRWWNNDPDALMIRRNDTMERGLRLTLGLLNEDEVRTTTINQYMGGGLMCSTEPLDKIDEDRLMNLKQVMPVLPTVTRPLSLFEGDVRFPENMHIELCNKPIVSIVRINWEDDKYMPVTLTLTEDILPKSVNASRYAVCDYYGTFKTEVNVGDTVTFDSLKPHSATVIKIEPVCDMPVVVASTGHYSLGGELDFVRNEDAVSLIYNNPFCWAIDYEIYMPEDVAIENRIVKIHIEPFEHIEKTWSVKR